MNCQIQGLSIHAEVRGTAEPALVFLHYWGGTSRTWRKVTPELEGQFKTVAYDARGWGKSDRSAILVTSPRTPVAFEPIALTASSSSYWRRPVMKT
jgi:pimeloyl-ACP methyl ester carboxylesterase